MEFYKIITFVILFFILAELIESVPTFGDEFVHIKVHVPKDVSNSHGVLKATHEGSPHHPYTSHKLVHHYHGHRKPFKMLPQLDKGPLLENLILSELDKPQAEHTDDVNYDDYEGTFAGKEAPSVSNVNTFTVIEEIVRRPLATGYGHNGPTFDKGHVDTFRVFESNGRQHQGYGAHVKTLKLLENDQRQHYHSQKSGYKKQPHRYAIQLVEGNQDSHKSKPNLESEVPGYNYQKQRQKTSTIVKKPTYKVTEEYDEHLGKEGDTDPGAYYDYEKPVVEAEEDEDSPDYKYTQPGYRVHEPVEVPKSKPSQKYHHTPEYEKSKIHYDYHPSHKEVIEVKEKEYPKYIATGNPKYHFSPKKLEEERESSDHWKSSVIHTDQVEYRKPSKEHPEHEEFEQREVFKNADNGYHYSQTTAANDDDEDNGYHYSKSSSKTPDKYHYHSGQKETHQYEVLENVKIGYKTPSNISYAETSENLFKPFSQKVKSIHSDQSGDSYNQKLPSTDNPPEFNVFPRYHGETSESSPVRLNTLFDEFGASIVLKPKLKTNIDWPEGVGKAYTAETYTGYDSYSAGHVQGLDS